MDTAIAVIVIGVAIYSIVMLFALGLCKSASMEDEEMVRAYHKLRDGGES